MFLTLPRETMAVAAGGQRKNKILESEFLERILAIPFVTFPNVTLPTS